MGEHPSELRSWKRKRSLYPSPRPPTHPPPAPASASGQSMAALLDSLGPPGCPGSPAHIHPALSPRYLWGKNAEGSQAINMGFQHERKGKSWDCCPGDTERTPPFLHCGQKHSLGCRQQREQPIVTAPRLGRGCSPRTPQGADSGSPATASCRHPAGPGTRGDWHSLSADMCISSVLSYTAGLQTWRMNFQAEIIS